MAGKYRRKKKRNVVHIGRDHRKAESIRKLIASIETHESETAEIKEWLVWASNIAKQLDPVRDMKNVINDYEMVKHEAMNIY